jgi:polyhydroxybutyrate depolymerase
LIGPFFVVAVALLAVLWVLWHRKTLVLSRTITVNGLERRYLLRSSDLRARNKPLMLCFHGGGGRVEWLARHSGLAEAGRRQGYMVVFPVAEDGWIDSRPERGGSTRDLDFMDALIDSLASSNHIDRSRVFAFGLSNGGLLLFRMAFERPHRLAGFATALANLPVACLSARPGPPVAIAMIFGRNDRVMPFEGGRIQRGRRVGVGGEVVSAQETLRFWLKRNRLEEASRLRRLESAGRLVEVEDYSEGPGRAPVRYVTVSDWGHRWPAWSVASSESSDKFNAADVVTEFFSGLGSSNTEARKYSTAAGARSAHA